MAIRALALAARLKAVATPFFAAIAPGLLAAAACTSQRERVQPLLEECRVNDLPTVAQCGRVEVSENRADAQGRKLSVRFAVVPAIASTPRPDPLVILVGGPGQAATEAGGILARVFSDVRRLRDIVLVDQRGTGGSQPLSCPDEDIAFDKRFARTITKEEVRACLAAQVTSPAQYATPMALDDLEAVRETLGYRSWNLWGGSYGSRVALAYMQRYPASIRRVVLDGAAPTDLKVPLSFARDAQRSLELAFQACAESARCQQAFPDPAAKLQRLLARLSTEPVTTSLAHPNTGHLVQLPISHLGFVAGLRSLLYSAELTALVPLALYQAADHNNWAPFVTAVTALTDGMADRPAYTGMYLSVMCAEDVPRITPQDLAEHSTLGFFGVEFIAQLREACEVWPSVDLPQAYFAPVTTHHPTLILSGQLDPATPPQFGQLVADRLPNSQHVTVQGVGHGVSNVGCVPEVIADFIEAEGPMPVDASCVERHRRPAFFTSFSGP